MDPEHPLPTTDAIREAAHRAVAATSLRATAREIGMSAMGLKSFLEGRNPYPETKRKLHRWFVERAVREEGAIRVAAVMESLDVLVEFLPADVQAEAKNVILNSLRSTYQSRSLAIPRWLDTLRTSP